jgi:predicted DCC family thiol-disulfide oxidoreductase YuxK
VTGTLLFDGDCGFCTSAATLAMRIAPAVRVVPYQRADLAAFALTEAQCQEALQFVGARRGSGAVAVGELLRASSTPWPVAGRVLLAPGIRQVAGVAYRWVANHRSLLPGGTAACAVRTPGD